jgi:hypothetical protein
LELSKYTILNVRWLLLIRSNLRRVAARLGLIGDRELGGPVKVAVDFILGNVAGQGRRFLRASHNRVLS